MLQHLVLYIAFISIHCTENAYESQCKSYEETRIGCPKRHPIYYVNQQIHLLFFACQLINRYCILCGIFILINSCINII